MSPDALPTIESILDNHDRFNPWSINNASPSRLTKKKSKLKKVRLKNFTYSKVKTWNYDKCKVEAAKFESLTEWSKRSSYSYYAARINKWQKQIARELGWKSRKVLDLSYWTYDRCRDEASNFSSVLEWKKNSPVSYRTALKNKWHKRIVQELEWNIAWTFEKCKKEASIFSSLDEWRKISPFSYIAARRNKWQKQIIQDLGWRWTYEKCKSEAAKFSSLTIWVKRSSASYHAAVRNQWQRQIAEELGWQNLEKRMQMKKQVKKAFEAYLEQCWNVCSKLPLPEVVGLLRTVDVKSASPKIQKLVESGDESLRKALHEAMAQRLL